MSLGPASADRTMAAKVRVAGSEDHELYDCIQSIVVNEDLDTGSSFQMTLSICRESDGTWPHLEDDNLKPWNRITIAVAFPDVEDTLFDGYISHIKPETNPETGAMTVDISGVDALYHLKLKKRNQQHKGSYESIAKFLLTDNQLKPDVAPEPEGADPERVTSQNGSDLDFLRELAARRGYEFYVRGANAYFMPPNLEGTPQKPIAIGAGDSTNSDKLKIEVDGTRPTEVLAVGVDPLEGETVSAKVSISDLEPMGSTSLNDLRGPAKLPQNTVQLTCPGAQNKAEVEARALGYLRANGWWVKASGQVDGLLYGTSLRTHKTVLISAFGEMYSGIYYVRKVRHTFGPRTYHMDFEATRNRLGTTGDENFELENPEDTSTPVAAGAGADTDVVLVAEAGFQVLPA